MDEKTKHWNIEKVGKIMAQYYMDPDAIIEMVEKNKKPVFEDEKEEAHE